jgi:very-short-patch-repair endonuclease
LKFRRQVPLGPYIADFFCPSAQLVVAVDGVSHIDAPGDAVRDAWMMNNTIRVLRVSNGDVQRNLDGILIAIGELVSTPRPPDLGPLRGPSPQGAGESSSSDLATAIFLNV